MHARRKRDFTTMYVGSSRVQNPVHFLARRKPVATHSHTNQAFSKYGTK